MTVMSIETVVRSETVSETVSVSSEVGPSMRLHGELWSNFDVEWQSFLVTEKVDRSILLNV